MISLQDDIALMIKKIELLILETEDSQILSALSTILTNLYKIEDLLFQNPPTIH